MIYDAGDWKWLLFRESFDWNSRLTSYDRLDYLANDLSVQRSCIRYLNSDTEGLVIIVRWRSGGIFRSDLCMVLYAEGAGHDTRSALANNGSTQNRHTVLYLFAWCVTVMLLLHILYQFEFQAFSTASFILISIVRPNRWIHSQHSISKRFLFNRSWTLIYCSLCCEFSSWPLINHPLFTYLTH